MFTDMVGYAALGQKNESLSLALVEEQRKLIRPILARHTETAECSSSPTEGAPHLPLGTTRHTYAQPSVPAHNHTHAAPEGAPVKHPLLAKSGLPLVT